MPGHNERLAAADKRVGYEASGSWDEPPGSSFPRRWAILLILGAMAYARDDTGFAGC
jgi:hypothetical protein